MRFIRFRIVSCHDKPLDGQLPRLTSVRFELQDDALLKDSLKTLSEITVIFLEEGEGSGTLEFTQLLDLKAVEIFKIPFKPSNAEFIAGQVHYRYNKLSFESKRKNLMLAKFKQEMQSRNPILYRAIDPHQKTSPRK
jgi:hypothetical protein